MCLSWKLPEGRYMTCPSLPQCLTYHSAWHTLSRLSKKFCSGKDGWIPFTMTVSLVKVIPKKKTQNAIIKLISAGDVKCPLGYSFKFHFTRVRGFPCIWSEGGFSGPFIRLHMTCQASKCDGTACRSELRRQLTVVSAFALWLEQVLNLLRALVLICSTTGCSAFLLISYQGNKPTFQIDQMFPVTVSRKQFLISYHYHESQ